MFSLLLVCNLHPPATTNETGAGSESAAVQIRQPLADFQHEKLPAEFNQTGKGKIKRSYVV